MIAGSRRKWMALALLLGVQFMVVLDIAIVNVALPSIQTDLAFSQENLQWVVSAYALLFGGFLLLFGRVADIVGRRRVFLVGIAVFTVASLLSGFAWSEGALIGSRAFQGFGAAMITPAALSILTTTFTEGKERNAALGAWGAVGAFGAVAGVLLGGVLTDALSWEWIFFVNVPVGVLGFVLAPFLLHESRDAHVKSFDAPGATLVTGGLVTLVYGITQANSNGWRSLETLGTFAGAAVLLAAFVGWERRTAEPLVPFSFFRLRTVVGANVAGLILGTAIFAMFLLIAVGLGFSFVPISIAALAGVPADEAGLASGLINTSQQIGGALGIAALSAIATSTTSDSIASGTKVAVALTDGFQSAFIAAAAIALAGILVALLMVRRSDLEQEQPVEEPAFEAAA